MRGILAFSRGIDAIVNGVGKTAAWLFIPMMAVILYDVTQRKIIEYNQDFIDTVFYLGSTKLQELEWHLHGTLFLLCLGFAYLKDAHVRIELVRDKLGARTRVWIELIGCLIFLIPYCILVVDFGWFFAERAWISGEISAAQTGLTNRWIIKSMLPIGFLLLGLAGVSVALKCLIYLFGPNELRPEVSYHAGTHHADLPEDVKTTGPVAD